MARSVLVPLPDRDFDVIFATEAGATPAADPTLLDGVIFGQLGAEPEPKRFYHELEEVPAFRTPLRWSDLEFDRLDGLFLPGGHAPGKRH